MPPPPRWPKTPPTSWPSKRTSHTNSTANFHKLLVTKYLPKIIEKANLENYKKQQKNETSSDGGDQLTTPGPQKDEVSYESSISKKRKVYKRRSPIFNQMAGEHANNAPLEKLAEAKKLYEEGDLFVCAELCASWCRQPLAVSCQPSGDG